MPKKRRKARPGVPPEARRFDDLLRDLESVRRRMRNYRTLVLDMSLLAAAMHRQMDQEIARENEEAQAAIADLPEE